jgi:hypothetical protein
VTETIAGSSCCWVTFERSEEPMYKQNLVAVFSSRSQAEAARSELLEKGVSEADIRLSEEEGGSSSTAAATATGTERHGGFLDWLFGYDVPERDRAWYGANLREGRTALSIHLDDGENAEIMEILEDFDPVEIEGSDGAPSSLSATGARPDDLAGHEKRTSPDGETVIPVVNEQLNVGKQVSENRYRVRTYPIERPVEQQVELRDERVVVERRPASRAASDASGEAFGERDFEIVERHEEPLVTKQSAAAEDVVIHKDVSERRQTVQDTVRETKVEVDQGKRRKEGATSAELAAAGNKPASARKPNSTP